MLWTEPAVAGIDCNDCAKFLYDLESGNRITYEVDDKGTRLPIERTERHGLQCGSCPKAKMGLKSGEVPSPDYLGEKQLNRRNLRTYQYWQEIQATKGTVKLPPHLENCGLFAANMTKISQVKARSEVLNKIRARERPRAE